ncbi:hypothetical protein C0Q70_03470 [Pomacea canaliculata]|uniref:ZP domain-containing protein n=1 Tax=Pomacea canaliculata TaxID=400727 RepID=A0A2T7PST8_POMCA|nr:hypothetical protein C0Q70_03470 [Pomacea canaliculata]
MIFNINPLQFRGRVVTLADINGPSTSACVIPSWSATDQNKPSGWEGFGKLHRYTGNGASDCIGNPYKVMDVQMRPQGDYEVYRLTMVVEYEPTEPAAVYAVDEAVVFECRVNRDISTDVVTSSRWTLSRKESLTFLQALPDLNGQSEKWIDLVDDRCFYPPTVQGYVMSRNKDAASVYFQAVRILPSFALHLRCSLYACTRQDQDKCDMRNIDKRKCPPRKPSLRRKRGISMPGAGFNYTVITTSILLDDTSDVRVSSVASAAGIVLDCVRKLLVNTDTIDQVLVQVIKEHPVHATHKLSYAHEQMGHPSAPVLKPLTQNISHRGRCRQSIAAARKNTKGRISNEEMCQ